MKLYELESRQARAREDAARPGLPDEIAARTIVVAAGIRLTGKASERASLGIHDGLALTWSPLYVLLRRKTGMSSIRAGLLTGTTMSLIADEIMTPIFEFSAPNSAYPLVTHLRGFVAHQIFGLAVAVTGEALWPMRGGQS